MRRAHHVLVACALAACDATPPAPDLRREPIETAAAHFTVDSTAYTLRPDGEGWTTSIGYVFRNPLADTIDVVNCNGHVVMDLQKHVGADWQTVWYGMTNACLSPGLDIAPGDSLVGRIGVWAADPGHPNFQTFETADMDGEFRLIWHQPRLDYSGDAPNFGDTLSIAQRTTPSFSISRLDQGAP